MQNTTANYPKKLSTANISRYYSIHVYFLKCVATPCVKFTVKWSSWPYSLDGPLSSIFLPCSVQLDKKQCHILKK